MNFPLTLADFRARVFSTCRPDLLYHSRIHKVHSFSTPQRKVQVLREDESGFGISGAKKRKYASLLPWLKANGYSKVFLIGGSRSNHIVGLLQLLREERTESRLYLKKEHKRVLSGNRLLLYLLADENHIRWVEAKDWERIEEMAEREARGESAYLISEGGSVAPSFSGAATLGLEVLEKSSDYDYIWIDSGTALMAGALIEVLQVFTPASRVQVVQMAGEDSYFEAQLKRFHPWMENLAGQNLPFPSNYSLHRPPIGRSFGSVGRSLLEFIRDFAREEGIITDPIYSGKLFFTIKNAFQTEDWPGRHLVIHSGGGMGLMGFGHSFEAKLTG